MNSNLRKIPSVHELKKHKLFVKFSQKYRINDKHLTDLLRDGVSYFRQGIIEKKIDFNNVESSINEIFYFIEKKVKKESNFYLKTIINATGVVLHTNLGRALLSKEAIDHVAEVAGNYSNLEYNIESGARGSRHDIVEELIKRLTGAEAAMVVNNNAAAVFLILRALSKNKKVIVSRGQLVEIGGSFRISSIMEESGAVLKEVGTTNKTHLYDYEEAVCEETTMIMKVHTSNFKIIGFTKSVDTMELAKFTKDKNIILYEDLGSGLLFDLSRYGLEKEPTVKEVLKEGADIVSFSGDKLLGGPQAGIIAGKKVYIDKLKKHQLSRVLRVDKLSYAALEATLLAYIAGRDTILELPTIKQITESSESVQNRAYLFIKEMKTHYHNCTFEILKDYTEIGGGSNPNVKIETFVVGVKHKVLPFKQFIKELQTNSPAVIGRIKDNSLLLDFRTIKESDIKLLVQCFLRIER